MSFPDNTLSRIDQHFNSLYRDVVNNDFIEKGDENGIKEREAENLTAQKKFKEALAVAKTISDLAYRKGTLVSLYEKCRKFGDEESLRFAIDLSFEHEEPKHIDSNLYGVFDACKKHKLPALALEAANLIEDPTLKKKVMEKINPASEFRDF